jgi:hypothetical protein
MVLVCSDDTPIQAPVPAQYPPVPQAPHGGRVDDWQSQAYPRPQQRAVVQEPPHRPQPPAVYDPVSAQLSVNEYLAPRQDPYLQPLAASQPALGPLAQRQQQQQARPQSAQYRQPAAQQQQRQPLLQPPPVAVAHQDPDAELRVRAAALGTLALRSRAVCRRSTQRSTRNTFVNLTCTTSRWPPLACLGSPFSRLQPWR